MCHIFPSLRENTGSVENAGKKGNELGRERVEVL